MAPSSTDAAAVTVAELPFHAPLDWDLLLAFLGRRAIPGVEVVDGAGYRRTARVGLRTVVVGLAPHPRRAVATLTLVGGGGSGTVRRCAGMMAHLADLGTDPAGFAAVLGDDPLVGPLLRRHPGVRLPGAVDGFEVAARAVIGQQVSVSAARTVAGRITAALGRRVRLGVEGCDRLFPTPRAIAGAPDDAFPMPAARVRALRGLATAVADGSLSLHPGADPGSVRRGLLRIPGVGPWTAEYVVMRALHDADAFPAGDLVVRRAMGGVSEAAARRLAAAWAPWRAYATMLLWSAA